MHDTFSGKQDPTIVLVANPNTYRAKSFSRAADRLGLNILWAIDIPEKLASAWNMSLSIDFSQHDESVATLVEIANNNHVIAILAIDDSATLIAADTCKLLGLPHNSPSAAVAARDKFIMRQSLLSGKVLSPKFMSFQHTINPEEIVEQISYPCVLKPLLLNGSRGVIRANNPMEFKKAWHRIRNILGKSVGTHIMVEDYIPGNEVAVEALISDLGIKILAIFDKPDPLIGPFFEETIYVTPSRLPQEDQLAIENTLISAARALGLRFGPIHAEFRLNEDGVWPIEIAGRTIGGLCSNILSFDSQISLEELVLLQASGSSIDEFDADDRSKGVMMIPIPKRGILRKITGIEQAKSVPGIDDIEITAKLHYPLRPLPEGDGYLGFIFAYGQSPSEVEKALRESHSLLQFHIESEIMLEPTK
ncbi:MAG: phosphoribosylglycinamide synthetase [Anaerolineaceae bacterium]|nr:phosphoribosylglycinamide synthetase [Anaerolineaceae bacterium]|tara:strand:- start:16407 stop:17666 length:1260 start_codon:yes stop_codon:yes gene_type:complete